MAVWNLRAKRKKTSGKYHHFRKKMRSQSGKNFTETHIGSAKSIRDRTRGGSMKTRAKRAEFVNLTDAKAGKTFKVKILDVVDNKANIEYIRRDIITKGAIISTEKGKARVTSRPGQHGVINAVLTE